MADASSHAALVGDVVEIDQSTLRRVVQEVAAFVEDNSVREDGSTIVNARAAWKPGRWEIYAEVLNIFDSRDEDIAYYYESYLPAIDTAPVEGRLGRVVEPLTIRLGAKFKFN